MKKMVTLGLAALMAVGATVASESAFAKPNWPNNPPKHPPMHQHHHNNGGFFFSAPFFFGFNTYPQYQPYPRYYAYNNAHVEWCLSRYRTYNPATDTYFIRKGVPAVCVSPPWTY